MLCQPHVNVVVVGTSWGPAFCGSCCRSLGTDPLVLPIMPTQRGMQELDLGLTGQFQDLLSLCFPVSDSPGSQQTGSA